jgi:hypothetical protein
MAECNSKISFPLQNRKQHLLDDIFPAKINLIKYDNQYYNEFALNLLLEQHENIIKRLVDQKTGDIMAYIDFYSSNSETELQSITDFTRYKYYYEITDESFFDAYINQCIITDKTIDEIISYNITDVTSLDVPVISINELQESMKTVSAYLIRKTKNILIEGVNRQTKIYSGNIDDYVDWYNSSLTGLDKTLTNIVGFIFGDKNTPEKFYLDNFNRIMNNNANLDHIIGDDFGKQLNIIVNVFYEYLELKDCFSVSITADDFIEPYVYDIVIYFEHVFEALDKADIFYLQEYTINDNNTALRKKIFDSMMENQRNKIAIINDPFNYLFDKLSIGSVLFVDNYFAGFKTYQHYGVYIGNGNVIHFAPHEGHEISMENGIIHETTLEKFLDGRALQIDMNVEKSFSEDEIVQRAKSRLGDKGYHLLTNNCEHFARWCVTGEHISYQVSDSPEKLENTLSGIGEKIDTVTKFLELFR